jgi:hypothetical protein
MYPIRLKIKPAASSAINIAASQSPAAAALTLTALAAGPIDNCVPGPNVNGVNLGLGRIIGITSGGNDSSMHWVVVGLDHNGQAQTENVTGASGGVAVTVNYYTSITSITPSASVASTASAGTVNTTASAQLNCLPLDLYARNGAVVQVDVSGTISYTVNQTFDDCISSAANLQNNTYFATPAAPTALTAQSASKYTALIPSVCGLQVLIPTYTTNGYIVVNVVQASNSTQG